MIRLETGPGRPLTILHIAMPGEYGGLERVVELLACGQRAAGQDVHVAALVEPAAAMPGLVRGLEADGVAVHAVPVTPRGYRGERRAVAVLCRSLRPDVVHTHGFRPDVVDGAVASRLGRPIVTTVHGRTSTGWRERLYERLQSRALRRFDAVVAVSRPLIEALHGERVPIARTHLIRNAWAPRGQPAGSPPVSREEARAILRVPVQGCRIGWVGRLSPEKGPDLFVESLSRLAAGGGCPAVSVLGDGPAADDCRARAAAAGLGRHVTWHGAVEDAGRLFRAFDLFVLSSRREGTPIVLFEAMAAGVPIVAAAVGGVPDVVSPAEARLVASADPGQLAEAIRGVMADPAAAAARARAAAGRLAREFGVGPWVARYDAVYRSLAITGGSSPADTTPPARPAARRAR